jgi:hypothetical protein
VWLEKVVIVDGDYEILEAYFVLGLMREYLQGFFLRLFVSLLLFLFHDEVIVRTHPVDEFLADQHEGLLEKEFLDLVLELSQRPLPLGQFLLLSAPDALYGFPLAVQNLLVDCPSKLGHQVKGLLFLRLLDLRLINALVGSCGAGGSLFFLRALNLVLFLFLQFLLGIFVDEIAFENGLILLARGRDDLGTLLLGLLVGRGTILVLCTTWQWLLFLVGFGVVAETLIDHIRVDVRVGLQTTTVGGVAKTVGLLLDVNSLLSALLADLFDLLDLISLLEVAIFNVFNAALILLLQLVQLVHAHVHDVFLGTRVCYHHTQVGRQL